MRYLGLPKYVLYIILSTLILHSGALVGSTELELNSTELELNTVYYPIGEITVECDYTILSYDSNDLPEYTTKRLKGLVQYWHIFHGIPTVCVDFQSSLGREPGVDLRINSNILELSTSNCTCLTNCDGYLKAN